MALVKSQEEQQHQLEIDAIERNELTRRLVLVDIYFGFVVFFSFPQSVSLVNNKGSKSNHPQQKTRVTDVL